MRTPPQDLIEADVGIAVAAHWSIVAETIEYAPIGFGSHHWVLTEPAGRRWFVTGDAVADSDQRLADLTAALKTAHALRHRCDLEFVSAPQVGDDGGLVSIKGRYALALYPYLEQITDAPADPQQLLSMITALHAATPGIDTAPIDDLSIRDRSTLEAVLANPQRFHRGGPYARDFADLVTRYQTPIRKSLDRYDALAATVGPERETWVITHGEPKTNNTMITASGPMLLDWDTVQLAPPARDLWMTGSVDSYVLSTGRHVPAEELECYRLRWDLKDLCGLTGWFTGPHRRSADTELGWVGSITICRRLANDLQNQHESGFSTPAN